jgi:hypothetical protein
MLDFEVTQAKGLCKEFGKTKIFYEAKVCASITLKLNTMEHQLFTGPLLHAIRSRPACSATAAW